MARDFVVTADGGIPPEAEKETVLPRYSGVSRLWRGKNHNYVFRLYFKK